MADSAKSNRVDLAEIDARIHDLMRGEDMVGLGAVIIENGEVTLLKGYGETLSGSGDLVTHETVFRWASISKGIASATTLLLAEEGHFNLTSPVNAHAESLAKRGVFKDVSLENILSHQTGFARNSYDKKIEAGKLARPIRASLTNLSPICDPGECHRYQNVLFDVVSEMAEIVTGLPYKAVVAQRIFRPLKMQTASLTLEGLVRSKSWAKPHSRKGEIVERVKPTYYRVPAAAGVNSSIEDMGHWMLAQMGQNEDVLPLALLETLHKARVETPRESLKMRRNFHALRKARYGYGWRIYNFSGRDVVGHRGAVQGYRAALLFDPELDTGVGLLWNSGSPRPVGLQLEIFDQVYGLPKRDWMRLNLREFPR
ncbi:MAG: serine hydrolase domain-containing protein [Maricaulaceae bacterium]